MITANGNSFIFPYDLEATAFYFLGKNYRSWPPCLKKTNGISLMMDTVCFFGHVLTKTS